MSLPADCPPEILGFFETLNAFGDQAAGPQAHPCRTYAHAADEAAVAYMVKLSEKIRAKQKVEGERLMHRIRFLENRLNRSRK